MNNSPVSQNLDDQSEIFLIDIVYFLQSVWKKLAISAVVGAVLGFSKGLEANTAPTASHKGMIKAAAAGFAAAFFLMLMFLLGQKAWASVKEQDAKAVQ